MHRSTRSRPTSSHYKVCFASETVVGLIARKDTSASKHTKIPKTLLHRYSPPTSPPPFKSGPWSLKKKWRPPLTMTPNSPITGVSTQGTKCLGKYQCLLLPIFWVFHLPSHLPWNTMLLATRHAIYSVAVSTEDTATFMLLPSWNKKMTTNLQIPMHHSAANTHVCKFLGTIPSNQLQYAKVPF